MSKAKKIVLNTAASYGRALLAMFVGVFSSRWLLMGLGEVDLGLMNLVGGLIGVVVIIETVMHVAVARFYAFAIGQASKMDGVAGRDEIQRWFNVVFLIYAVLPAVVLAAGYPLGVHAISNWLTIPSERMEACIYMFRCSIFMTFAGMLAVPYVAMYKASQNIVELSLFDVARTVINFFFTLSLLYVMCDKLKYAATFSMTVSAVMLIVQMCRAKKLFPECKVRFSYLWDYDRIKRLFAYFFWEVFSCTGNMTREKAPAFILNKCYGPSMNAAWAVASTMSAQAMSLSASLTGALLPAVTTEEGAGNHDGMVKLAFRTCKFSALLILVFSIPLIAEMDEVLKLWLVAPPTNAAGFCMCILIAYVIDKLGVGHHVAISAKGKIGLYHSVVGTTYLMSVPIALLLLSLGCGAFSSAFMFIVCFSLITVERIIFARYLVDMPVMTYVKDTLMPLAIFTVSAGVAAALVVFFMPPSFFRIVVTTAASLIVMTAVGWGLVLDSEERVFALSALQKMYSKFGLNR